jgi:hypothetical protein
MIATLRNRNYTRLWLGGLISLIGGLIATRLGLNGIILIDATSFLLAALLIVGLAAPRAASQSQPVTASEAPIEQEKRGVVHVWREWIAGLRVIAGERTLAVLLTLFAITSLGEGVFSVLYPLYVYQALDALRRRSGR